MIQKSQAFTSAKKPKSLSPRFQGGSPAGSAVQGAYVTKIVAVHFRDTTLAEALRREFPAIRILWPIEIDCLRGLDQIDVFVVDTIEGGAEEIMLGLDAMNFGRKVILLGQDLSETMLVAAMSLDVRHVIPDRGISTALTCALRAALMETSRHNSLSDDEIVLAGTSREASTLRKQVAILADCGTPICICGERGTGKSFVARELHRRSRRNQCPFVRLECGALHSLAEHVEAADTGTLHLENMTAMTEPVQRALVRFLDSGAYRTTGETTFRSSDVRVISSSIEDLWDVGLDRSFHRDLLFRLAGAVIFVPSLRERTEDITFLARLILVRLSREHGHQHLITSKALSVLETFPWPGNISQLRQVIHLMAALCGRHPIDAQDIVRGVNASEAAGHKKRTHLATA